MAAIFEYLEHVNVLKRLPRTGWLLNGVVPCESVADHSFAVALLAIGLAETVNEDWAAEGLERPLDVGQLVTTAVVHDLAEGLLTDLPKRTTELLGREAKHAAEARAMAIILGAIADGDKYLRLWGDYNSAATPEARLVRDADKLEMVHQALVYERAGQRTLQEFWEVGEWHYAASARVYVDLRRQRS
jgi:putative hydrolases of HD superfamily